MSGRSEEPLFLDSDEGPIPSSRRLHPPSRNSIPPFEALRAFDAVARLGGIRRAAENLGRDHAVISRHLRTIETWTGTKLIDRTPTGVVLTDDGRRYHKEIAAAMESVANATIDLMRRGDHRRLLIWCAPGFALHWMSSRMAAFEAQNPGLVIELKPTESRPDFAAHEADISLRFAASYGAPQPLTPGLRSVVVARVPIMPVTSAAYLARTPEIAHPRDLIRHRLLHEFELDNWANWLACYEVFDELNGGGPRLWGGHLTLDAAIHGRGIALLNKLVVEADIAAGRVIDVGNGKESFGSYPEGFYTFTTRADRWDAPHIANYRRWFSDALVQSGHAAW